METYKSRLLASIDDAYNQRSATYWVGSIFERLITLTADERGRWGEDLLHRWLHQAGITHTWDGDSNTSPSDGIYDIKVKDFRVEVKTASRDGKAHYQHDGLYSRPLWDKIAFVDVDYDNIYLTIMSYDDLAYCLVPERLTHKELGKGATLRKSQTDKYKFDFSHTTISNAIKHGHTLVIPVNAIDPEAITSFLSSKYE